MPFSGGGGLRSFKVVDVNKSKKPIAEQANSSKITIFMAVSPFWRSHARASLNLGGRDLLDC